MSEKITALLKNKGMLASDIRNLSWVIDHLHLYDLADVVTPGGGDSAVVHSYRASVPAKYLEDALRQARKDMIHEMHKMDRKVVALEELLEEQES